MGRVQIHAEFHFDHERCGKMVWIRDTYRYSGRGRGGFTMHYVHRQCSRRAQVEGLCWQHARMQEQGQMVVVDTRESDGEDA